MKKISTSVALIAIGIGGSQAIADNGGQSAECKGITARLIELTGTSFDHYSPSGDNVFFRHPDMHLSCTNHRLTGVSLNWDLSGFPPNEWFTLLALAGKAVTGVDPRILETAAHKCHRAALKDKSELADLDIPNAKIECQAFTRDGGGVDIGIWINEREARKGVEDPK
jgi:hypothetical protein